MWCIDATAYAKKDFANNISRVYHLCFSSIQASGPDTVHTAESKNIMMFQIANDDIIAKKNLVH